MIKFFRKIRQQMLKENKFSKYILYAIGEIMLVSIGILIALQVNNWKEGRTRQNLKMEYLNSLKRDLTFDIVELNQNLSHVENDLKTNMSFSTRLSSPNTTKDTLIKIARYEFNPLISGSKELNQNTYNALIATGNIDLLGKELTEKIQEYYAVQANITFYIKTNFQSYVDGINQYTMYYPINIKTNAINGVLQDSFWEDVNPRDLQSRFNSILTGRIFMFTNEKVQIKLLLDKTQELLDLLKQHL